MQHASSELRAREPLKQFFSQALWKQALMALLLALVPLLLLTLWFIQSVAYQQRVVEDIYANNQKVISEFNELRNALQALEKAQLNNQLLQSEKLQKSINDNWQKRKNSLKTLLIKLEKSAAVANWQQSLSQAQAPDSKTLSAIVTALARESQSLQQSLDNTLNDALAQQSKIRQRFLIGLSILLPVLIGLSIWLIKRISRQLFQLEQAIEVVGAGQLATPIQLSGSHEFTQLGERLEQLRNELAASKQQKETFLRHVSHELKTPLSSIKEGTELLNTPHLGQLNDKQRRIIGILSTSVTKLTQLIEDLLTFSAASHPHSQQARCSAQAIKEQLEEHFAQRLQSTGIQIDWRFDPALTHLPEMPVKLALTHLLGNAIQYTQSQISIDLTDSPTHWQVSVRDDGPGLDPQEAKHLFKPFVRGKQRNQVAGSGLGLAIVEECVTQFGGQLGWQNIYPGCEFSLTLPKQGKSK
ncbi:HAMP domain-containing sensor histidine kinase [Pseudoalteromonas sp. OOF1S-7]|uniref:HAMP domain-containing sensor histidine kinase n=1 Tax=Pseudoalteromonas sp. OOF1S-7 TaxID=2917757 RepID=UPI001EF6201C|nr:HAMP domain-containing sensor histidine kinase [Pseudoalteromonas sp. OOF1S-7]MCG7534333.1 HAMP domain-containing histidine kinase [Pseudoalteromonas sp. OOF1S-7]